MRVHHLQSFETKKKNCYLHGQEYLYSELLAINEEEWKVDQQFYLTAVEVFLDHNHQMGNLQYHLITTVKVLYKFKSKKNKIISKIREITLFHLSSKNNIHASSLNSRFVFPPFFLSTIFLKLTYWFRTYIREKHKKVT